MDILLISRINTDNLGDQAIHEAMKLLVTNKADNIYCSDLCNYHRNNELVIKNEVKIAHTKKSGNNLKKIKILDYIWAYKNREIYNILKQNKELDYVFIGGGELIASSYKFCFSIYNWARKLHKKNKKTKIILFGVGVNNNLDKNDIYYMKKALKIIKDIYVRDTNSYNNFKKYFGIEAHIIPDVVFANDVKNSNYEERKNILYGLTNYNRITKHNMIYKDANEYYEESYKEIDELQKKHPNKRLKLFYTTQSDIYECLRFKQYIEKKYKKRYEMSEIHNLSDLNKELSEAMYCASPRMHGCILATINGVSDVVPILISEKMKSYNNTYGNVDYNEKKNVLFDSINNIIKK